MGTVDFKFGTLIRTGPNLTYGGKWDVHLVDWKIDRSTKVLSISLYIPVFPTNDLELLRRREAITPSRSSMKWGQ